MQNEMKNATTKIWKQLDTKTTRIDESEERINDTEKNYGK